MSEKILKKMRNKEPVTASKYLDLHFILATSNICWWLFSEVGFTLTDRCGGISPQNFESQMDLHIKSEYWGIGDVPALTN